MPDRVLVEVDHPLVRHKVTLLRDAATTTRDFRQLASEIAGMLAYEATRELDLEAVDVTTPLGARSVRLLSIIAAPEGIAALHAAHPDVEIYCATINRQLNEVGYILPGLGDAGDRIW